MPVSNAHVACLLGLTFTTGIIDALSWIGLDGVFTANMTGNVLIIGMGIIGAGGSHWFAPLFALVVFMLGAAVAGRIQRHAAPGWGTRTSVLFGFVALVVIVLGVVTLFWQPHRFASSALVATGILGFVMGVQGAEAIRLAVPTIITVAVSSTVVRLGTSLFLPPDGGARVRQLLAIALLIAGALAGSLLQRASFGLALLCAGMLAAAIAAFGHTRLVTAPRPGRA